MPTLAMGSSHTSCSNCVGIGNHKYFLLFVFYTFLTCCYSLSIVIFRFATCVQNHEHGRRHSAHIVCLDSPTQMLNVLGLLIEGLLFGMFTSCMMYDQSEVIRSKLTHIDRLKGDANVGGNLPGVIEVFGIGNTTGSSTRFRWDWMSPFHKVRYPPDVVDEVMGFGRNRRGKQDPPAEMELNPSRKLDDIA